MIDLKSKANNLIQMAKNRFGNQVEAIAKQEAKVKVLLSDVGQKLVKASKNSKIQQVVEPMSIFMRMVKSHFSGTHKLSNSTLGMVLLALVYFLSPFDLMPDFLGLVGFVDDVSVVLAVYAKIKTEVNEFLEWEKIQSIP
jgi:uncharacterized membrane protein YkvA (DUF1232 family)